MNSTRSTPGWTVDALMDLVPKEDILAFDNVRVGTGDALYAFASKENPLWFRGAVQSLLGSREELIGRLQAAMHNLSLPLYRVHVAMVLLGLGDAEGIQAFLDTLRNGEAGAQRYALDLLPAIWMACRRPDGEGLDVPLSAAQAVKALAPLLAEPASARGAAALRFCLGQAFAESEQLTQPLMYHTTATVRMEVAEAYLRAYRDSGALRAVVGFLAGPLPPQAQQEDWKQVARHYANALLHCARGAPEPLKAQVGRTALSVLRTVLTQADFAARLQLLRNPDEALRDAGSPFESLMEAAALALGGAAHETLLGLSRKSALSPCARACAVCLLGPVAPEDEAVILAQELVDDRQDWPAKRALWLGRLCARLGAAAVPALVNGLRDWELREHLLPFVPPIPRGPHDAPLLAALREALADERGGRATAVAHALFERGDRSEAVIDAIDPQQAMEWHWRTHAIDAAEAARVLAPAGVIGPVSGVTREAGRSARLCVLELLHGGGCEVTTDVLDGQSRPDYARIFSTLIGQLRPALDISRLEAVWQRTTPLSRPVPTRLKNEPMVDGPAAEPASANLAGLACTLGFMQEGRSRGRVIFPEDPWRGVIAVLGLFDELMAAVTRPERAFCVELGEGAPLVVAAREQAFTEAAKKLRIPLRARPEPVTVLRNAYPPDVYRPKSVSPFLYADGSLVQAGDAVLCDEGLYPARVSHFLCVPGEPERVLVDAGRDGQRLVTADDTAKTLVIVARDSVDYALDAVNWLLGKADEAQADARFALGNLYLLGKCVDEDRKRALQLWLQAAEQDEPRALHQLGLLYAGGKLGLPKDAVRAAECQRRAAALGYARSQYALAVHFTSGSGVERDFAQAALWYRRAAEQNDSAAQYNLGVAFMRGLGTAIARTEAAVWFRRAAENGHVLAQYNLALCYQSGSGVAADAEEAVRWLQAAAGQFHPPAMYQLAEKCEKGLGLPRDIPRALALYTAAADKGDASALYRLGVIHQIGRGVLRNREEAIRWFERAQKQGHNGAAAAITVVRKGIEDEARRSAPEQSAPEPGSPAPADPNTTGQWRDAVALQGQKDNPVPKSAWWRRG